MSWPMHVPWTKAGLAAVIAAMALFCRGDAFAACSEQPGAPVILRPVADTRLMRSHQNANDGAAGLVWLKRSSHVRGLVGFDLSCQAAATPALECATLDISIQHGHPRTRGNFSAHRMLVPWVEGNQSFNEYQFDTTKLGPFSGTGVGTTWDCRLDPDISDNTSNGCDLADKWDGTEDCGTGVPCYDPVPSTANYASLEQLEMSWDVTSHVVDADSVESWLLKVEDETVKSSAFKFYTRNGVQFMAEVDPLPGAESHFDLSPRLLLWGPGVQAPTATLVSPVGLASENPAPVRITQNGPTIGATARWANATTGGWGWMTAAGGSDWTASVPLAPGPNEIEFTVFDGCGTEGRLERTIIYGSAEAFLCYRAGITSDTEKFTPVLGLDVADTLEPGLVDLKKLSEVCLPADVDGTGITDPLLHGVTYQAKTSGGEPAHVRQTGLVVYDRFGTTAVDTQKVDRVLAPAALARDEDPTPLVDPPGPYKCYRAKSSSGYSLPKRLTVHVTDAFEDRDYWVRHASRLCFPSPGPSGVLTGSAAPLLCYRVSRALGEQRHRRIRGSLRTIDDLGPRALDTRREAELCVSAELG